MFPEDKVDIRKDGADAEEKKTAHHEPPATNSRLTEGIKSTPKALALPKNAEKDKAGYGD